MEINVKRFLVLVIKEFHSLLSCKEECKTVTFCVGTEAADIDSVSCSIATSFLHYKKTGEIIFPVINTTKKLLKVRIDVLKVLEKNQIFFETDLIFLDQVQELVNYNFLKKINLFLVDQNETKGVWKNPVFQVVSIIDHHKDEGKNLETSPRIISPVKSCCTLVFDYFKPVFYSDVFDLLLSGIVYDTFWLKKGTDKDFETADFLLKQLSVSASIYCKELKEELDKNENENLLFDLENIILYDRKSWTINNCFYSISSNFFTFNKLVCVHKKEIILFYITKFIEKEKLLFYVMMLKGLFYNGKSEFLLVSSKELISLFLISIEETVFKVIEKEFFSIEEKTCCYLLLEGVNGRKKFHPILEEFLKKQILLF